ncbi:MAG: pantetheine-phosphate adenylyltransferase [Dehalococcoidia bacterium]|nr:pantetheine-phosphate adenylyltransferase [Dehalococcoidia bacterium]
MTIAMYPGRFDPVTNGHMDIVGRAASIYDSVVVSVVHSGSTLFSTEERVRFVKDAVAGAGLKNVQVTSHAGLTVDAAHQHGATVLVRGLRAITDFTVEFDMALMNRNMAPEIESAFLMTAVEYLYISASRMRELASLGRDVSDFVPPGVNEALRAKFATRAD